MNFLSRYHRRPTTGLRALQLMALVMATHSAGATCLFGPPLDLEPGTSLYDRVSHQTLGRVLRYETNRRMEDGSFHNAVLVESALPGAPQESRWLTREFIQTRYATKVCRP